MSTVNRTVFKHKNRMIAIVVTTAIIAGGFTWHNRNLTTSNVLKSYETLSGVQEAKWASNVSLTYESDYVTVQTNDIPNHERDEYYAVPNAGIVVPDASTAQVIKDPTRSQNFKFVIPLHPVYVADITATPLGSIGLMISGSVLFNPYEGDGKTVAMSSNFQITDSNGTKAWFVDHCSGHPTPNSGEYHYHALSTCISNQIDLSTGPSHIEGLALDGFPIYGPRDIDGNVVPVSTLDACNGIDSPTPEFPEGIYHYVLPETSDATSSIRCFHGKVDRTQIMQMPNMGPMP